MVVDQRFGGLNDLPCLVVVDFAAGPHHARQVGRGLDDEPGVDGYAMSTNPGPWAQHVYAGVSIGDVDHFPDIDIEPVANQRKFVGERNVGIAEGILRQLYQFGCPCGGRHTRAANEHFIEALRQPGAGRRDASDATIVIDKLSQDPAWQDALRAVSNVNRSAFLAVSADVQVRPALADLPCNPFGRSDWGSGL